MSMRPSTMRRMMWVAIGCFTVVLILDLTRLSDGMTVRVQTILTVLALAAGLYVLHSTPREP
jgi:hypothetical protein